MKRTIFSIIFISFLLQGFADVNQYPFIEIKKISNGKKAGEIGYYHEAFGGMPSGPTGFTITESNEIIVPDFTNKRLNVYDMNMNYVRTIVEKDNVTIRSASRLIVDDAGDIFASDGYAIKKIDKDGNTIFHKLLRDLDAKSKNLYYVFLVGGHYFYYNDDGNVECVTKDGRLLGVNDAFMMLEQIDQTNPIQSPTGADSKATSRYIDTFKQMKNDRSHIFRADRYFDHRINVVRDFYKKMSGYYEARDAARGTALKAKTGIDIKSDVINSAMLIAYDNDHNSYWRAFNNIIFIVSSSGKIIDGFACNDIVDKKLRYGESIKVAVAPSGDVYFMRNDETGSSFWKVVRQW